MSSEGKRSLAAFVASIVILAGLAASAAKGASVNWLHFWYQTNTTVLVVHNYTGPLFLAAAMLMAWKGAPIQSLVIAVFAILLGAAGIIRHFMEASSIITHAPLVVEILSQTYFALGFMAVSILWVSRLRGRHERFRIVGMGLFAGVVLFHQVVILLQLRISYAWIECARAGLAAVSFFITTYLAWCVAFRQEMTPNRPPIDARRLISMACPRCAAAIVVPAGHGECEHCRLHISIALEEGVCRKCRYPLRGLTGEKCPECGEALAVDQVRGGQA